MPNSYHFSNVFLFNYCFELLNFRDKGVGEALQREWVVRALPTLLEGDITGCLQKVLPKVTQMIWSASTEYHLAASNSFRTIAKKNLVPMDVFRDEFLPPVLKSINDKGGVVAASWMETLHDLINYLPPGDIKAKILPIAVERSGVSKSVQLRVSSCHLLGRIATRFDVYILKREVLPLVLSLCQDMSGEVRSAACLQLPILEEAMSKDVGPGLLLPCLVELAKDEEARVREAAIEASVAIIPCLTPEAVQLTIIPLLKQIMEASLNADDMIVVKVAQVYAPMMTKLEKILSTSDVDWFLRMYGTITHLGKAPLNIRTPWQIQASKKVDTNRCRQCRQHCAANFSVIAAIFIGLNSNCVADFIYPIFCNLMSDNFPEVRRNMARSIHEVSCLLGRHNSLLRLELVTLLRNEQEDVLQGFLPNLGATILQLVEAKVISPEQTVDNRSGDLCKALMECERKVSMEDEERKTHNWRLHVTLIAQLEVLPQCFPSDFIYENFAANLCNLMTKCRTLPCRLAAIRTVAVLLRYNVKPNQRQDLRTKINDLSFHRNCYHRMNFVKASFILLEFFSSSYFKQYFFRRVILLADDPVPNIRLCMCRLMPRIKAMIQLPADKMLFTLFENAMRSRMMEKDPDVLNEIEIMRQQFDKMTFEEITAYEKEDIRKFEEERLLALKTGIVRPGTLPEPGGAAPPQGNVFQTGRTNVMSRPVFSQGDTKATEPQATPKKISPRSSHVSTLPSAASVRSTRSPRSSAAPTPHPSVTRTPKPLVKNPSLAELSLSDDEFLIDTGICLRFSCDNSIHQVDIRNSHTINNNNNTVIASNNNTVTVLMPVNVSSVGKVEKERGDGECRIAKWPDRQSSLPVAMPVASGEKKRVALGIVNDFVESHLRKPSSVDSVINFNNKSNKIVNKCVGGSSLSIVNDPRNAVPERMMRSNEKGRQKSVQDGNQLKYGVRSNLPGAVNSSKFNSGKSIGDLERVSKRHSIEVGALKAAAVKWGGTTKNSKATNDIERRRYSLNVELKGERPSANGPSQWSGSSSSLLEKVSGKDSSKVEMVLPASVSEAPKRAPRFSSRPQSCALDKTGVEKLPEVQRSLSVENLVVGGAGRKRPVSRLPVRADMQTKR